MTKARRFVDILQQTHQSLPLVFALALILFAFVPQTGYAHPVAAAQPVLIALPPYATVEIAVGGFCQNRGQPFPGPVLTLVGMTPPEVQQAIHYGASQGLLSENVYQVQLAVWGLLGSAKPADSRFSVVSEIMAYAHGNGEAPAATSAASLLEAVKTGLIAIDLSDFQSASTPDYYGVGTLRLTNLSGAPQEIAMPYGALFQDNQPGDTQNMGIFPQGVAVVVSEPGPPGPAGPQGDPGPQGPAGPPGEQGDVGPQGPAGPQGEQGVAGLSCWDTNGNGKPDKAEDVNSDGKYDALDCMGAAGPQGEPGEPGAQGPKGDAGPMGLAGPIGPAGPQGPQGEQGEKGDTGPQGEQGIKGDTGPQGPVGPVGPQGEQGEQGDTGPQGPAGPVGPQGEKGNTGPQGVTGDTGPQGPIGPPGPAGIACWDGNENSVGDTEEDVNQDGSYNVLDCLGPTGAVGPQGPAGPQGKPGASGPMGPAGPVGPQGPIGPVGPSGEQGEMGPQGEVGPKGSTGPQGPQGEQGATGAAGPMGPVGPQGEKGDTGPQGPMGASGPMGPVGPKGDTGPQGPMGMAGLACWDQNGDGVTDQVEDVNGDGNYDANDCVGPMGAAGVSGAPGPMGPVGPQGPMGPSGPPGLIDVVTVMDMTPRDAEPSKSITVLCDAGMHVLGGGFDVDGPDSDDWIVAVQESYPVEEEGWHVRAEAWNARVARTADCNCADDDWKITVWAICGEKFPAGKG